MYTARPSPTNDGASPTDPEPRRSVARRVPVYPRRMYPFPTLDGYAGRMSIDPEPNATAAEALAWITGLLNRRGVTFQLVGGAAARAWGATRPLVDLDFYVDADLGELASELEPWIVSPSGRHVDEHWDLVFLQLDYRGQTVELAQAAGARYRDPADGRWRDQAVDFDASVDREVLGVTVPVMPRGQLLEYKRRLRRPVDERDVREIEADPAV